jgi:hypothetical protein
MLSSLHLPTVDLGPGMLALILLSAGAALAVAVILVVAAFRRAGRTEVTNSLWGGGLVLVGGVLAALLIEHPASTGTDAGSERRAIERQAADLTVRAIAPGSALACLDTVASAVADACEKAVFARPEAVAAAVDFVDARLSLLAAGTALADREPSLRPLVDRLRTALEADRFGLVAHVLTTRGCGRPDCSDLKLLHDPARVLANMAAHTFEVRIGTYAMVWQENGLTVSAVSTAPPSVGAPPSMAAVGAVPSAPTVLSAPTTSGSSNGGRLEFPSAASIPPVSIMAPEPAPPAPAAAAAASEPKPVPTPPKRPAQPRRQTAHEQTPPVSAPPHRPAAPAPQRQAAPPQPAPPPPTQAAPEPQPVTPDVLPSHGVD